MILAANFQSNSDAPQYLDNPETLHHLNAADKNDIAEPLETAQTFLAAFELADAGEQVQREVLVYQYTNAVHARHKRHHVAERYRY